MQPVSPRPDLSTPPGTPDLWLWLGALIVQFLREQIRRLERNQAESFQSGANGIAVAWTCSPEGGCGGSWEGERSDALAPCRWSANRRTGVTRRPHGGQNSKTPPCEARNHARFPG